MFKMILQIIFMAMFLSGGTSYAGDVAGAGISGSSLFEVDRRRDQYGKDFAYFAFPFASEVPGYGSAVGAIGLAANIAGTDTDAFAFYMDGDFSASGLSVLDIQLIPKRLIFDVGMYNYAVVSDEYGRSIDSDPDDYLRTNVEGEGGQGQLTLTFMQRMLDTYVRYGSVSYRVLKIINSDDKEFTNFDTDTKRSQILTVGFNIDITDDRLDPRKGLRFEGARRSQLNDVDPIFSKFNVYDWNLTGYLPMGKHSTWVFNVFRSDAHRKSTGSLDPIELEQRFGLDCDSIIDAQERLQCEDSERKRIDEILAQNQYGYATPLGGTQRLRGFVNNRFHAGHSVSYGTEFRWNITEEQTLMDWYILKGLRTNIQAAFFAEAGSVADHSEDLHDKLKYIYGVGARIVFSGAVLRFDIASGDEGVQTQLFINYPWSLFSVDRPG